MQKTKMGLTYVDMSLINPADHSMEVEQRLLVDSGAFFSVVPAKALEDLGIEVVGKREFTLANGEIISRKYGNVLYRYQENTAAAPVVFGEKGDSGLLGVLTLEALGLLLDPFKRQLKPLKLLL